MKNSKKLSAIIPSWKDKYMPATVQSLLDNSGLGDMLEVVVVLDGYEPKFELVQDPRVRYIRQENTGMRGAINRGVKESSGEFIARFDEHQSVGKDWDKILVRDCGDNEIMTVKRFFLDPVKWEVMDIPPALEDKLIFDKKHQKLSGSRVRNKEYPNPIFEITAMQGSMWCMKRSWWDKVIGELQTEGYGPLYQDSIEMIMKTWQAGGRLMMNHNTWHAHKHRSFSRTHNINREDSEKSFNYAWKVWGDYYLNVIKPKYNL